MRHKNIPAIRKRDFNRTHRHQFLLNDEEEKVFARYISKYHIKNQSKFIREAVISAVIRKLEEDYPTLF